MKLLLIFTFCFLICISGTHAQWQQCGGTAGLHVNCIAIKDSLLFAGTDNGIFFSDDTGSTWMPRNNGITADTVLALLISGNHVFAGTQGGGIFITADTGLTWQAANNGITDNITHCFTKLGARIFAGADSGEIFLSADTGLSWTLLNSGITQTPVNALTTGGSEIFAAHDFGIFVSADSGSSWTTTGITVTNFISLAAQDPEIYAGAGGDGVFYTPNNFAAWSMNNNGLSDLIIEALAVTDSAVFAGSDASGVFASLDHSASWSAFNTGLTDLNIRALAAGSGYIFAGTLSSGIWRRTLADIATTQEIIIPDDRTPQIFPNPFSTQLTFVLSSIEPTTIVIYDLTGQQILMQASTCSLTVNIEQFPRNIYFYELRNDKGVTRHGKVVKQ